MTATTPGPGHLGALVAALVDGQLGHAERDRVLSHLARCPECRSEVAEQRALKARLDLLDVRTPRDLADRLLAFRELPSPWPAQAGPDRSAPQQAAWAIPAAVGSPRARPAEHPVVGRAQRSRRAPMSAVAGLVLVGAGLGGIVAVGAPADEPYRDPSSPDLVVQHATTTTQVPLADPAVVSVTRSSVTHPAAGVLPAAGGSPVVVGVRGR